MDFQKKKKFSNNYFLSIKKLLEKSLNIDPGKNIFSVKKNSKIHFLF